MSSENISFLMQKWTCRPTSKRGRIVAIPSNATHMWPVQILAKQTQNLPETNRNASQRVLRGFTLHSLDSDT